MWPQENETRGYYKGQFGTDRQISSSKLISRDKKIYYKVICLAHQFNVEKFLGH